MFFLFFFFKTW